MTPAPVGTVSVMVAVLAELMAPSPPELRDDCMARRKRLRPHCFSVLKWDSRCDVDFVELLLLLLLLASMESRFRMSLDLLRGTCNGAVVFLLFALIVAYPVAAAAVMALESSVGDVAMFVASASLDCSCVEEFGVVFFVCFV